jgi:hypothetical protein
MKRVRISADTPLQLRDATLAAAIETQLRDRRVTQITDVHPSDGWNCQGDLSVREYDVGYETEPANGLPPG